MKETKLYVASVEALREQAVYEAGYRRISPERQARTDRFRFDKDKRLSVGAELLLQYALHTTATPPLFYGAEGKPYLKNGPFFNLSHSGTYVLCAVSFAEVGCDIEEISRADLRIAERFFTLREYEAIRSLPAGDEQNELFYRYWVLKESFIKSIGAGMKYDLRDFEIDLASLKLVQHFDRRPYRLWEGNVPGYRIGLCLAGNDGPVSLNKVDLGHI